MNLYLIESSMLALIRKKQKPMAMTSLSLFVSAWLLLMCQACFANGDADSVELYTETIELEHCHKDSQQTDFLPNYESEVNCVGVCDCHETTVLIQPQEQHKEKSSYKFSSDIISNAHNNACQSHYSFTVYISTDRTSLPAQNSPVSLYNTLLI